MVSRLRLLLALPVAAFAGLAMAQAPTGDQAIDALIKETRDHAHAYDILEELVTKFGPRVTGSDALLDAQHWAVRKFADFGVDDVWLEEYQQAPVRFQRNAKTSWGGLSVPYRYQMAFSTPAYTVGTNGPVAGPAVKMPANMDDAKKAAASLKGAWVLMPRAVGMGSANLSRPNDLDKFVESCGIAGRIYSTNHPTSVWTHGSWAGNKENRLKTPLVTISKNDYGLVEYNMAKGRSPVLEFNIDQRVEDRPTPLYNVVAEIRGSINPSEYVVISGHFDSWDGYGSQGAMDNGTGSSMVLELARVYAKLKIRPLRSIRFILWSGEEQGLLGSRGYTEKHKDDLSRIQAVFVEDHGQNPYQAIVVQEDMKPYFESVVAKLASAYPEFPFALQTTQRLPGGGSDHGSFIARGVPGFQLQKADGPVKYAEIWHTQLDQIKYVQRRCIAQNATYVGVLAYHLANMQQRLPKALAGNNRRAGSG